MLTSDRPRPTSRARLNDMQPGERGYPRLFFYPTGAWALGFLTMLVLIGGGAAFYVWYMRPGADTFPGSPVGLVYAVIATIFFILAAAGYALRRRSRKRAVGQLNASLNWHIFLAIIALGFAFFHALGNFAAISGTYALIGLLTLALSGMVGRFLDRVLPRMITAEVDAALTAQGEDRGESLSQELKAIITDHSLAVPPRQGPGRDKSGPYASRAPALPAQNALNVPWDLAYISLEPTQQELDRDAPHYRFIPDRKSNLSRVDVFMPPAEKPMAEMHRIQQSMEREQRYRRLIRLWRSVHITLAIVAVGLIIYHLIFVGVLFLPGLIH
jgi:hypothetical protein